MSQYIDPSIDFIKSLIKNKDYIICNSCEHDNFSIMCFWKDKEFIITKDEFEYIDYFEDYFNVIEMLELNGIEIITHSMYKKMSYSLKHMTLYLEHELYYCNYQNIREVLKNVIDKILIKNKAAINT
jgi:hypothetical protein